MRVGRTEADEQKAVLQWCVLMEGRWSDWNISIMYQMEEAEMQKKQPI